MTNKEFLATVSQKAQTSPQHCQKMVNDLADTIINILVPNENEVAVSGLGSFEIKKKSERIMSNPSTGKKMLVPPRMAIVFKMSSSYKNKIN